MRKALVAVCHNGPVVLTGPARSLQELGWGDRVPYAKQQYGFDSVEVQWFTEGPRVDMLRNQACQAAITREHTHLIFLDADMTWPTTIVRDLLAHHDHGIVAGLYVLKGPPYAPVHLVDPFEEEGETRYHRIFEFGTELMDVDVVGMGCTIIPVSVLQDMGEGGWFFYENDKHGMPRVSEDVPFCRRAKEVGARIRFDPTIRCDHWKPTPYGYAHHVRYQQSIEASKDAGPVVSIKEAAS